MVSDFEQTWNLLAARQNERGGGNFMFALLAMILLEFACRVCRKDATGQALRDFSDELQKLEPRYFTTITNLQVRTKEFTLPGQSPQSSLLALMFDLIRNGKAHQYQSAIATLSGGQHVDIDISGAASGRDLSQSGGPRRNAHLRYKRTSSNDVAIYVRTEQLYLDIKQAIEVSGILTTTGSVDDVKRTFKQLSVKTFVQDLSKGGLREDVWASG